MWRCKWFKYIGAVVVAALATGARAQTIGLAWDAPPDTDIASYQLYRGTASGVYGAPINVGNVLAVSHTVPLDCTTYYLALKARDIGGNVSVNYSNEVSGWARVRLASVVPNQLQQGSTTQVTITGANLQPGVMSSLGSLVTWGPVTVNSCTSMTVSVTVGAGATTGPRTIEFKRTGDGVYGTASGLISVVADTVAPAAPANFRRSDVRLPL